MVRQAVRQQLLDHDFPISLNVHLDEAALLCALCGRLPSRLIEWAAELRRGAITHE